MLLSVNISLNERVSEAVCHVFDTDSFEHLFCKCVSISSGLDEYSLYLDQKQETIRNSDITLCDSHLFRSLRTETTNLASPVSF